MVYQTLIDLLNQSTLQFSSQPALTMRMGYRTVTLTYNDVERIAKQVAVFLAQQGVQKGDRVAICAPNSPYWVCIFWGCLLRGAVFIPLAPQYTPQTLENILASAQPKIFFTSMTGRYQGAIPTYVVEYLPDWVRDCLASDFVVQGHKPDDLVEIMYTSGTTGDPKGVMLTHGNIMANVHALKDADCMPSPGERMLSILPLSHMLEQSAGFILPYASGAHIVYAHSHAAMRGLLQSYKVTKIVAVPEFLKLMLTRLEGGMREHKLMWLFNVLITIAHYLYFRPLKRFVTWPIRRAMASSLGMIACGGSSLDPELESVFNDLGIAVLQGYGLTETSPTISINTIANHKQGSLGQCISNVQLRLTENGECEVKGPSIFSGYYNNPEKTKESFTDDGWFKTGDMLLLDADGFLSFKGRKKYMIKGPGAQNIFPEDIETVLNHQPGVQDSCVIGVTTKTGMMEIHAVLLLADPALDLEACIDTANEHLASYQHVTGWSVWPDADFPRSVTRKVKRELVVEWVKNQDSKSVAHQITPTSKLKNLLAQVTGVPAATLHESTKLVADLKFDSLMRIELVARVDETFNVMLDERLITSKTTISDLEQLILHAVPVKKMPHVQNWPNYWWARAIRCGWWKLAFVISRLWIKLEVKGLEHLEGITTPVIFMPNHVSLIDGVIIALALPGNMRKRISFAAAYDVLYGEYWAVRWLIQLVTYAFPFPRREHEHIATGLLNLGAMLDKGYNVAVFPEGMVSKDGKFQPLKRGAGLIAIEMGVPVIPVKIVGLEKLVPYDYLIPRARGVVTVKIGKPMIFKHDTTYDQAVVQIEGALRDL